LRILQSLARAARSFLDLVVGSAEAGRQQT